MSIKELIVFHVTRPGKLEMSNALWAVNTGSVLLHCVKEFIGRTYGRLLKISLVVI